MQEDPSPLPDGPLSGYRVLELTTTLAGPFCGRLLADFGAEVIKVEPPHGDDLRSFGARFEGEPLYALSVLRNKSLIALDLRTEEGQQIARNLAAKSDLVIENFRPGTLEGWNLGYETLAKDNPKLVMVRISAYGQTGPYRRRPGYGVIAEAVSGLRHLTGHPDAPPPRMTVSLTDYIAAVYAAFGAVMALHHAMRSGQGQVVDTALSEGAFSLMEPYVPAYGKLGTVQNRAGHRLPFSAPNNLYFTRDERFILIAAHAQGIFKRLCIAMGQPGLVDDARFAERRERADNEDALDTIVSQWTESRTLEQLEGILHEAEIPASRVFTIADIFADPQYKARSMLVEAEDETLGPITVTAPVPKLSATPGRLKWLGRRLGADTARVLEDLAGLSVQEIERLEAAGVIVCDPGNGAEST